MPLPPPWVAHALLQATASLAAGAEVPPPAPPLPNFLVVVLDDVGADLVGAYGASPAAPATPRLDALCAEGASFTRAWAAPNCSPARALLLTGRFGFRTGIGDVFSIGPDEPALPLSELTLPELLAPAGYASAAFGKWHLGNATNGGDLAPNLAGFGHYRGVLGNLSSYAAPQGDYFAWTEVVDGVAEPGAGYLTSAETDSALAWIGAAEEPWLCQVAYHAAHTPYHVPPPGLSTLPPGTGAEELTSAQLHAAVVEALDAELGRLVDGLGPLAARTVVVVLGDNGTAQPGLPPGTPPGGGKHTLRESGLRVPLVVRGPPVLAPGPRDALVQVTDVLATLADLAGVDAGAAAGGAPLDGLSLAPLLVDPAAPWPRAVQFAERFRPNGPGAGVPEGGVPEVAAGGAPLCQADLGLGGPGTASLSLCSADGQAFVPGSLHTLAVAGAPPFASGWLAWSTALDPVPFAGGALAPGYGAESLPFGVGPTGEFELALPGAMVLWDAPVDLVLQGVLVDPEQPYGFALTNALAFHAPPVDIKTVRNADDWKLVVVGHGGHESLYHLPTDPHEQHDWLATGEASLPPDAAQHLARLRQGLLDLLATAVPDEPGP